MRSRSSSLEDGGGVKREEATARARRRRRSGELSRDDLLFLLSMLEGELQARDEVITVLRAEKMDLSLLEATYGFVTPQKVLRALQRDALQSQSADWQDDVYETPMSELERVVQTQRETYGRMLEQLLLVEQAHRQTLTRLEREKTRPPRHALSTTPHCSGLLERQRLKLLIQQEKENQEKKEEENSRTVSSLKDELTRLKTFALQLVDEQQRLTNQLHQQTNQVHKLQSSGSQAHVDLSSARTLLHQEQDKVLRLEQDLHTHTCRFQLEQETMTATLTNQDAQNRQLRLKLSALSRQVNELEEANKSLHRAQEELQELRDKISRGECGDPGLESEVEKLRKRVLEMEGKDEELLRTEDICRDLHRKLEKESEKSRGLKLEVTELSTRILELEKLEEAFGRSKQECSFLKNSLEKERTVTKHMSNELDVLQDQIRELQASHVHLEKTELTLKEELAKLKTLTVILVDERRTMEEKLKLTEDKVHQSTGKLQVEQDKLNTITEKLIEESKKALRSKAELEEKMCSSTRERDELRTKLRAEERKNSDLQTTVSVMKKKLQSLEAVEKELLTYKSRESSTSQYHQQEDNNNKMNDLSQEVGRLKRKLKEMTVVESEFLNTEDDCELLDERFSIEQEQTKALTKELEVSRKELSKHQLAEKKEAGKEHDLHHRLKDEEAKSSHLLREVEALREKIHDYMSTEELLSRLKTDYGSLQRKLAGQEVRNRELAREMEGLTRELERYRRFSKSLRPGLNGRRFSDLHVSSKEVQTEPADSPLLKEATHNQINLSRCSSTLGVDLNTYHRDNDTNPAQGSFSQHPAQRLRAKSEGHDVLLRNSPAGPLHIRVTPDHAATLDITSPAAEHVPSFTSTALIPTRAGSSPLKQRITILQNTPRKASPPPSGPARALTPMQIVSVSTEPEETEGRWQRSSGPSIITTDDQKIHIHLGSNPFLQAASSAHCVSLSSQQKIPVSSKITSSILIKPTATAASRSTHHTTVPLESFRRSGPTRIPKPKGCSAVKGTSGAQASLSAGKTLMDQTAQS